MLYDENMRGLFMGVIFFVVGLSTQFVAASADSKQEGVAMSSHCEQMGMSMTSMNHDCCHSVQYVCNCDQFCMGSHFGSVLMVTEEMEILPFVRITAPVSDLSNLSSPYLKNPAKPPRA